MALRHHLKWVPFPTTPASCVTALTHWACHHPGGREMFARTLSEDEIEAAMVWALQSNGVHALHEQVVTPEGVEVTDVEAKACEQIVRHVPEWRADLADQRPVNAGIRR